jgi:hypothetical protein
MIILSEWMLYWKVSKTRLKCEYDDDDDDELSLLCYSIEIDGRILICHFFSFHHRGLSLLIVKALENDKQIKLRDESVHFLVPYIFHLSFCSVCSLKCWFTCHRVITLLALNFYQRDTQPNPDEQQQKKKIEELFNLYASSAMSCMFVMFCDVGSTFVVYFVDLRLLKFYKIFDVCT